MTTKKTYEELEDETDQLKQCLEHSSTDIELRNELIKERDGQLKELRDSYVGAMDESEAFRLLWVMETRRSHEIMESLATSAPKRAREMILDGEIK